MSGKFVVAQVREFASDAIVAPFGGAETAQSALAAYERDQTGWTTSRACDYSPGDYCIGPVVKLKPKLDDRYVVTQIKNVQRGKMVDIYNHDDAVSKHERLSGIDPVSKNPIQPWAWRPDWTAGHNNDDESWCVALRKDLIQMAPSDAAIVNNVEMLNKYTDRKMQGKTNEIGSAAWSRTLRAKVEASDKEWARKYREQVLVDREFEEWE